MKKLFCLCALSLFFIYGCSKDDSSLLDSSPEALNFKSLSITPEEFQSRIVSDADSKSANSGANGHFNTPEENKITFGSGADGGSGNWNVKGVLNFKGKVICTTVEGNQAVVQLVITHVGDMPAGAEAFYAVGYTHLFLVEDNGEGHNAPKDRYWDYNLFIPAPYDFCFGLGPAGFIEIFGLGLPGFPDPGVAQFKDTAKKSDQIQVK